MKIRAHVVADSINPDGQRCTTIEAVFNRYLLAELNTHRDFSRNSASSRAVPVKKVMKQVWSNPAMPIHWGANQAGMQANEELKGWRRFFARLLFKWARIPALLIVWFLTLIKLHKQVANRLLEPWVWHTVVVSSTEWENFFKLRLHPAAQPEFQELARCIDSAMAWSVPQKLEWGDWHLPYTDSLDVETTSEGSVPGKAFSSAARCARVSYVRQNEERSVAEDIKMAERLLTAGHWSPFEHPAQAVQGCCDSNFRGFKQMRKFYAGESGRSK